MKKAMLINGYCKRIHAASIHHLRNFKYIKHGLDRSITDVFIL